MPTEEERFQEERKSGLGGSDCADLFSLEPYGCVRRLYFEKRGIVPDYEPSEPSRRAMRRGVKLESIIAEEYSEITGRMIESVGIQRHKDHEFLMVHMDRLIWAENSIEPGYLEVKAPGYGIFKKIKAEGLSDAWQMQLQHGLLVTGYSWGSFAVMDIPNWKLIHFDVEADQELQDMIFNKALEFWPKVENGPTPDAFPPSDPRCKKCEYRYRCHGNTMFELEETIKTAGEYTDGSQYASLINEVLDCQDIEDEAHKLTEDAKQELRRALETPQKVKIAGAKANWISFPKTSWDHDALNAYMAANPNVAKLFEKFRRTTPQQQLRVERC